MASTDNTGFCVPYTVRDTSDKGRGVFANAPIRKGTILWRHIRRQYTVYDERSLKEFLAKLSRSDVVYELTHDYNIGAGDSSYYDALCEQYDVSEPWL